VTARSVPATGPGAVDLTGMVSVIDLPDTIGAPVI
jgi:hypothetical protein